MTMLSERRSEAERIACLPEKERQDWFHTHRRRLPALEDDWSFWGRPDQMPPVGDWRIWLVMAGRGFGKTRAGAEWVRAHARANGDARIALIGATMAEVRSVMVEGASGLLSLDADPAARPVFEPSLRRLVWPSGAIATLYSAAEPDSLRGPEHDLAWADEIAKWSEGEAAWSNLAMMMRRGGRPRLVATTTPRPVPLIRRLLAEPDAIVTRGRMDDNRAHLPGPYRAAMAKSYGGTRLGRQELDGELIGDVEGALWSRAMIEAARTAAAPPPMVRIVIGVDPPAGQTGDACGIIVTGLDGAGLIWVLADASVQRPSPATWARAVAATAAHWQADRVIAEKNNGGEMVESVLRAAAVALPIRLVHATHGKAARAEPVAALYEQGRVRHAGAFPALDDELCGLKAGGGYEGPGRSPDRADALVWAVTELVGKAGQPGAKVRIL